MYKNDEQFIARYYQRNKEILQKRVHEKYQNLSEEEKEKRLVDYRKTYYINKTKK